MKKFLILFTALALVCAFTLPAAAMEEKSMEERLAAAEELLSKTTPWGFYGSARMSTFWLDDSRGNGDDDLNWDLQGNSRFGAVVKHNGLGGGFEFAVNDGTAGDSGNVGTRKLYGVYNFGAGNLLIGQTYPPTSSQFYSNQVYGGDEDLLGSGQLYTSRRPMIQFGFGDLKIALVKPTWGSSINLDDEGTTPEQPGDIDFPGLDVDTLLPKLELGYKFKTDMFFVEFDGGYQTVDTDDPVSETWDSYVAEIGGGFNAGIVKVQLAAHYIVNGGIYGAYSPWIRSTPVYRNGEIFDNEAIGGLGVVTVKATDMLAFEVGVGYRDMEIDGTEIDDNVLSYYGNCVVNIAPGFFIVPEIGIVDIDSEDDLLYLGAKWQINF